MVSQKIMDCPFIGFYVESNLPTFHLIAQISNIWIAINKSFEDEKGEKLNLQTFS
jgi:hypothetical protein